MIKNIRDEILESFEDLFTNDEMVSIYHICVAIKEENKREKTIQKIQDLFRNGPKRPVYYLIYELTFLPDQTRDVVRYCGDYLDQLAKMCVKELGLIKFLHAPFGIVIDNIKNIIKKELQQKLKLFNQIFYTEAKHNFEVYDRDHLFSPEEVVFCCFITRKLADAILAKSFLARLYNEDKIHN